MPNPKRHTPDARPQTPNPKRRRGRWLARLLARRSLTHRLLRGLARRPAAASLLEEGTDGGAAHQMRWANAREQGSALPLFVPTPRLMEPENFGHHMEQCRCVFWRWFLACGIEKQVRTVLDVGCGTGYTSHHFVWRGYDVTGVTCNLYEKSECLRRGMRILEEDFHFLSVPDDSFDLVFSSHSLEHSIAPLFALWEWRRVLRPGGYLMIATPAPIDQDARAAYPRAYDPASDSMLFPPPKDIAGGGGRFSFEEGAASASTYGDMLHPFVLTYWQLKWLCRLSGLEWIAEGVEDPIAGELCGIKHADGRIPCEGHRLLVGLVLLQKPEQART